MHIFDELDHKLIAILREDGRASLSKLATILGVSRGTVQARLDRLLETGAALGFTIRVRQDYDDGVVHAIMLIEVQGRSTTKVIKLLRGLPQIRTLHTTNGSWDLVAEIHAESLHEFDRVLREVRTIEGVLNSETSILLSSV
ncbi:Lrp/AsnC family transcriptional regulator [Ochrobactrum sp. Sa2BUA5]|jgi:DNA-binding Lrp family transcriptional regulator|uniref:Lrp/AsnC family transcriptional regulator n=1 Tax=Ochrobactrum quorumnocens TaxID=271865 RepID=A0A5N1K6Z4_9HYPH|nr:Lrp/AsnC family transcriptional regulator [[Ochrobactrum] quorumnocens]KAA9371038.1 Lrp/AsnC family transcriptional regulator [[Ochrobactrum] quorumnocens]MBD7991320.1 Lrp/AsnC family transcriptional regulator [Ochrobactrum gallinarum]